MGSIKEALESCNEVLEMEPENIDALIDRAEAHITNEEYDKGGFCVWSEFVSCCCSVPQLNTLRVTRYVHPHLYMYKYTA